MVAAQVGFALPSDALLDSLALASAEHEQLGRLSERDQVESLLETLARQRIASDSSPEVPHRVLEQIDRLRGERSKREATELSNLRQPVPEVVKMLEQDTLPETEPVAAVVKTSERPSPPPAAAPTPTTLCAAGPVKIDWMQSSQRPEVHEAPDSIVPVRVKITAPCGLSRIDLFLDETLVRSFPVPVGKSGTFEFTDAVAMTTGIHRLDLLACDSAGICTRSIPLESKVARPVSPWIPRAVGGLVGLCIAMGLALSLRKLTLHSAGHGHSTSSAPLPQSSGVSATIRHRLQLVAKETGPSFPAVSLRLPDAPPDLSVDPESLGEAFGNILRLHARRTKDGGQILVAMGHGPMSAELVFEDTGPTPDEDSIPLLLDPAKPNLKERMDLDQELESARQLVVRSNGSMSMEARIDGGLRTRVRLKLAVRKVKA